MTGQQLHHATMSVLDQARIRPFAFAQRAVKLPLLRTRKLGALAALLFIGCMDIAATLVIASGGFPWLPAVLLVSVLFGFQFGKNDKVRLQSLAVAMSATAFTWLGVSVSAQLGFGTFDERIALALRSYICMHCGAIIVGHMIAHVANSRVRVVRRAL